MKRVLIPVIFILAILVSVMAMAMEPDPSVVPFDQAVKQLNTPEKVNAWMQKHMALSIDRLKETIKLANKAMESGVKERTEEFNDFIWGELVRYPSETYANLGGVCCDIANFATHCLKQAGYDAMVVGVRFKRPARKFGGRSHAVCVVHLEDGWYAVSNPTLSRIKGLDGPYPKLRQLFNGAFYLNELGIKYVFNLYTKKEGQTVREQYHEWSPKEFCKLHDPEK